MTPPHHAGAEGTAGSHGLPADAPDRAGDTRRVPWDGVPADEVPDVSGCGAVEATAQGAAGGRIGRLCRRLVAGVHPPDIWGDRPGLAKLAAYARRGVGAPDSGPLRTGQIWWFRLVCLPITAWAYWKAWALERPLRGVPVLIVQCWWWLLNMAAFLHLL